MRHSTDRLFQSARSFTRRVPSHAREWREAAVRAGRAGLPPVMRALRESGRSTMRAGAAWRRAIERQFGGAGVIRKFKHTPRVSARVRSSRAEVMRRRRIALLGGGTLLAALVLVGLVWMAARVRSEVDAAQKAPLHAAGAAGTSRTRADLSELEGKLGRTETASEEYKEAAGAAVGDDAGVYQIMGDWLEMQHTRLAEYHQALRDFMMAGSIDGTTLTSKEEIGFRIALAEKLRQASKSLTEVFTHGVESLPERMEAWGVSEARAEEEIARLRDRNDWPIALELRQLDEEAMGLFVRYLTLLKQTWGEWTYDEATSDVTFTDKVPPGTIEEFNDLAGTIRRIAREQGDLRGKLGG